jgi:LmbE family N-acetylglucosaminyl deacetylase
VFLERLKDGGAILKATTTALIVAHPDDELIGAGAQLPRLRGACVLHVTDGAPRTMADALAAGFATREAYARTRRHEAEAALAIAGIPAERIFGLGIADQDASFRLADLGRMLVAFLVRHCTEIVITHAYEGGHPDHDATAFGVHAACALIRRTGTTAPAIIEMAGYHGASGGLVTHEFPPCEGARSEVTVRLTPEQRRRKRRMIHCHATQAATLAQFGVDVERFRAAPAYDFHLPPHTGPLWYERFGWGVATGEIWRRKAMQALSDLALADARAAV